MFSILRVMRPLLVLALLASSSSATTLEAGKRAAEFRALIRADASVSDGAKYFIPAAENAAMVYDRWLPADFDRAIGKRTRANSDELNSWYKLAYQELHWLWKEARRLNASCDGFGPGDPPAREAARKAAAAARRFQSYLNKAPWDDSIRATMLGEGRTNQAAAIKDWDKLVRCVDGKKL